MAFFGKLRLSKATTLMLLFALVMGMMNISVANAQEVRNSSFVAMRIVEVVSRTVHRVVYFITVGRQGPESRGCSSSFGTFDEHSILR